MSKLKMMLPLWLVLLFFGSAVYMVQTRSEKNAQYQSYVDAARYYADQEVVVDAISNYRQALALYPSAALYTEAGDLYLKTGGYKEAQKWYSNDFYRAYPNKAETYSFGIRSYLAEENYRKVLEVYDEFQERELSSEEVEELVMPIQYSFDVWGDYADVRPFGNLSQIAAVKDGEGNWGYIDRGRDSVLGFNYQSAGMFNDLAAVIDENGEAYFLDQSGNKKITENSILHADPEIGQVKQFLGIESDLLWAYNGSVWNCYNAQTFDKICGGYAGVTNITNGVGAVQDKSSKWALISANGEEITDFLYDEVLADQKMTACRTDALIVREGENYLLLNRKGEKINDTIYEDACPFYDSTLAAVKKDGKWLFVDETGKEQDLGEYDEVRSFSNGLAAVRKDEKWGYIKPDGTLVIDCQFDEAAPFGPLGVAFVKTEGMENWSLLTLYKYNHD